MGGVAWSEEEDHLLRKCIEQYGEGKWHRIPLLAGINRCRKSCRLRWLNYLRPNIKRGKFTEEEVELIIKLHNLLGNRWSLIAGRLPGRTANDVKNYWHCHLSKRLNSHHVPKSNLPCRKSSTIEHVNMEINRSHRNNEETKSDNNNNNNNNCDAQVYDNIKVTNNNVSTEEIITCVQDNLHGFHNNNVIIGQSGEVNVSCQENMTFEELQMDIDFDLEEIKISGSDHRKCNWDFDDLLFNMET